MAVTAAGNRVGSLAVTFFRLDHRRGVDDGLRADHSRAWLPADASPSDWLLLAISGFFGFFLCDICLFEASLEVRTAPGVPGVLPHAASGGRHELGGRGKNVICPAVGRHGRNPGGSRSGRAGGTRRRRPSPKRNRRRGDS